MIRSKSLSQGDLIDCAIDSSDYRATSNIYSLHELSSTGNKLPLVIRIDDGFYGKTDWTTISSDEILFLYALRQRRRALATAADGTRYSFPLDYPLLFIPLLLEPPESTTKPVKSAKQKTDMSMYKEVPSHPMSLKEIVDNHKLPISVMIDDADVTFHSSNHDRETVQFGKLTLTHVYDEKYFVGNEIRNGNLSDQITLVPTFLRIKVRLVQGFQKKHKLSWKSAIADWSSVASKINYDAVAPPSDVAAFQSDVVAKVVKSPSKLDALEPNTYIRLTFLPIEVDHTYEELPIVQNALSSEPSVSTFKLTTKPSAVSRSAIQPFDLSTTEFNPYNTVESPTDETTSFRSNSESSFQPQNLCLPKVPAKRMEPRSYSPVPSPPITMGTVKMLPVPPRTHSPVPSPPITRVPPPGLLQKPINRAPMPLPKSVASTSESRPTSDILFADSPQISYGGFTTADRSISENSRLDTYGKNEFPRTVRTVPLPPALKPSDLQKALKPVYKSFDLGSKSTSLDTETTSTSEERTAPRKPKPQKPRSKTDLALTTSARQLLHQDNTRHDIKSSEPGLHTLPLSKNKAPPAKPNKAPLPKIQAPSTENNQSIADTNRSSSSDYDELVNTESTTGVPQKFKPLPLPPPRIDSKSSLIENEVFRAASPKLPLPPPPEFLLEEYEFPTRDSDSPVPHSEQPTTPKKPQLSYEKLPTKDEKEAIQSIADIPDQLDKLSCFHLASCLRLLNMESYVTTFLANQIDGKLLLELDEEILTSDLKVSKLHAKKLLMFAHRSWRP